MDNTYNFNYAQCVKEAHNFGSDVYTNICNGATSVVNWGSADWFWNIAGITFFGVFVAVMLMAFTAIGTAIYYEFKS